MTVDINIETVNINIGGDAVREVTQKDNQGIVTSGSITIEKLKQLIQDVMNEE